jgi:hypothetical protein
LDTGSGKSLPFGCGLANTVFGGTADMARGFDSEIRVQPPPPPKRSWRSFEELCKQMILRQKMAQERED